MDTEKLIDLRKVAYDHTLPMTTRQAAYAKYEAMLEQAAREYVSGTSHSQESH